VPSPCRLIAGKGGQVINHPGDTSAIIGPRTMEQLEAFLPAADVTLSADVLDAIDKIIAPGATVNPVDNSYGDFELRADQRAAVTRVRESARQVTGGRQVQRAGSHASASDPRP
jgi:hypothetical protein